MDNSNTIYLLYIFLLLVFLFRKNIIILTKFTLHNKTLQVIILYI